MSAEHTDRADWTFTNWKGEQSTGSLILDSRTLTCIDSDGTVAWTRLFKARAHARASFEGDLRAMRKNDCYSFEAA